MSVSDVHGFGRRVVHPPGAGESTEIDRFEAKLRIVTDAAWAVRIRTRSVGVAAVLEDGEVSR